MGVSLKKPLLNDLIVKSLEDFFTNQSFKYKKKYNQFEKIKDDYRYIYNIQMAAWSYGFSISVKLYIEQKQIENVYEKILGKSNRLTLGNTLQRIYNSPDGREVVSSGTMDINIINDSDVEAAIESLEDFYNRIAKPYYEKYQDMKSIDDIINNPPFENCPADVGGIFADRCMKGLIVARFVNNPNYEQLVKIYDEAIKETMHVQSIESYYKVREHLIYNPIK